MIEKVGDRKHRSRWAWAIALTGLAIPMVVMALPLMATTSSATRTDSTADPSIDDDSTARVDVTVIRAGSLKAPELYQTYRGEIRARRESSLAIRRGGQLAKILVHEGDRVRRGDPMAELNTDDLDVREQLADADVAAASAAATEAVAGPRYTTLKASAARVRQLKALLASSQSRLERQQRLSDRNSGSAQELDDAKFATDELQARLDAATAELEELNEGTRTEQVEAAKAKRSAAIAARKQVDVDREDSRIVAPYDGVIANRYFDEGEMLSPGEPVFRILETQPVEARFGVPPDIASGFRLGTTLTVAIGSIEARARVVRMQPQVDPITRTRGVDLELDSSVIDSQTLQSIMIGQTALLKVQSNHSNHSNSQSSGAFWLPSESLVRGSRGLWSIYVAVPESQQRDGSATIQRREVRIVRTADLMSLVEGMLRDGEMVVSDGAHRVGPGVPVSVHVDSNVVIDGEPPR